MMRNEQFDIISQIIGHKNTGEYCLVTGHNQRPLITHVSHFKNCCKDHRIVQISCTN